MRFSWLLAAGVLTASLCGSATSTSDDDELPLYVQELYAKSRANDGRNFQKVTPGNPFTFGIPSLGDDISEELELDDRRVLKNLVTEKSREGGWQPFIRELYELEAGRSAGFFPGKVATLTQQEDEAVSVSDGLFEETTTATSSLDLIRFSLDKGYAFDHGSVSLDVWWSGLDTSDEFSGNNKAVLEFEVGLVQGERSFRTTTSSVRIASLPKSGNWLSLDMTAALEAWQVFIDGAETGVTTRLLGTDDVVTDVDFTLIVSMTTAGSNSGRRSAVASGAINVEHQKRPLLTVMKKNNEEAAEFTLSESGIRHLQEQAEVRVRERRATNRNPGPDWANGQQWRSRNRKCQLFDYEIDRDLLANNIVLPRNIPFNICHGFCRVPFIGNLNASTHATLAKLWDQQSVLAGNREDVTFLPDMNTECVPVSFKPLPVLSRLNTISSVDGVYNLEWRIHRDVSANACGCR